MDINIPDLRHQSNSFPLSWLPRDDPSRHQAKRRSNNMIGFHSASIWASIWRRVATMFEADTSRQELAELDDASLKDIGISRAQAAFEASRHRWNNLPWTVVMSPTRDRPVREFSPVSQKNC
jgi:uncharacterized protein YjiS (DUF1127 family)